MTRYTAPQCITFDLDDTLWDSSGLIANAEQAGNRWLEQNHPRIIEALGYEGLLAHRRAHYETIAHLRHDLTASRKHWLGALAREFGYGRSMVEPAFRAFWEARNAVELFAGSLETLETVSKSYRTGVITNGNADVHFIGIGHCFDFVVTSESVGCAKPDARIFEAAMAAGGADPGNTVHVGDHPQTDVGGASALGIRTVWVNPALAPWPGGKTPDAVVRSVTELPRVLETWSD